MKKLILMYPNQAWQKYDFATSWVLNPSTLCQLAAMVKNIVQVKIVDANFYNLSEDEFANIIKSFKPDYVGISVLTSEYGKTLDITAKIIKNIDKNIVVIAGGVHAIIEFESIIKNFDIDFVVRGEGEYVLKNLINFLNGEGHLPFEGLVYRDKDKVVIQNSVVVKELDKLPWPDFELVNLNDYLSKESRKGPLGAPKYPFYRMTVTRGCPFGCSFCQVETIAGKKIRTRNAKKVIEHLYKMKKEYGIKSLIIDDDNMIGNTKFFDLCHQNKILIFIDICKIKFTLYFSLVIGIKIALKKNNFF